MQIQELRTDSAGRRDRILSAGSIFALALLVRAIHAWQIGGAPFADLKLGDAWSYHLWAQGIAGGDWLGDQVFYQAPLYPYFLAAVYSLLGDAPVFVRAVQALLGALSCALIALTGWRMFSRTAGIAAGILLALYAPAIFFDGLIQKSALDLFLLCLALWLASGLDAKPVPYLRWYGLGLAMGALVLTRENALIFVVGVLLWLAIQFRSLGWRRIIAAALFLAGLAALLLPVALRNQWVGGEFHLTTSQFGPNFFIGNHAGATGIYQPLRPGRGDAQYERLDAISIAEKEMGRSLTPGEVSAYFTHRSLDYIRSQPGDWLHLQARKTALAWNATEMLDSEDQYTYAGWSIPLRWTGFVNHFGVLAPLALLGILLSWGERGRTWLLHLLLALYTLSVLMFYVLARYRYPMVPFLVLFAGAGIAALPALLRGGSPARIARCAAAVLVFAVFCNWPIVNRAWMRSTTEFNIAEALARRAETERAVFHYRTAIAIRPDYAEAHSRLGGLFLAIGDVPKAKKHLGQALRLDPDLAEAHLYLAKLLSDRGDLAGASARYEHVLRIAPDNAVAHYNLGNLLFRQRDPDRALSHYRAALSIDPAYVEAHLNVGSLFLTQGRLAEAATHLGEAVRLDPSNPLARYNLGLVFELQGDIDRAVAEIEQALRLEPDFAMARRHLEEIRAGR